MNIFSLFIIILFILIALKTTYFLIKNREKGVKISKHQTQIKNDIPNKNKWLYPTDKLGKIERGVVYDEKVFDNKIKETKSLPIKFDYFKKYNYFCTTKTTTFI